MNLKVLDLGMCDYEKAHALQKEILEQVYNGEDDTLILVEHPKVITMGRNANEGNMLFSEDYIKSMGYDLAYIERGGDATYHGPGQLVGYPIFNIKKNHGRSIRRFVETLEEIFIDYLKEHQNIEGRRDDSNSGVFIGNSKVTALGLAVKKGITMHGFAFNVNTNLNDYGVIVPCGLTDKGVTSLEKELGSLIDMTAVKEAITALFAKHYKFETVLKVKK